MGITGCMGSGKTRAARYLQRISGVEYIDADAVCRDLLRPGASGWNAFVDAFGRKFFMEDNETINRPVLRDAIFKDSGLRARVNAILHPMARESINEMVGQYSEVSPVIPVLVEAPLLFEAKWEDDFDSVVVVYSTREQCIERLKRRDHISIQDAQTALAAQEPIVDKALRAHYVVENTGVWADTCLQLLRLNVLLWG
ncbi:MAG: dephospho-CoA kinase [Desulfobulbaceae bacterium]|nr:dephospho-CoA kinase [Desulfobulbaceae bacterium]MCK5322608.1 dephospho-CoA kinase [Desulfobulbaceae bacterium]MCK5545359.1 dephospho-CoA kinase [Desulfobulbaceae bacterium]